MVVETGVPPVKHSKLCNDVFTLPVVQRMDNVTEGIQNYGGKINAVETDLKKLGKSHKHFKYG